MQAFEKWGVEPVAKIGRETFYRANDVLQNRLDRQAEKYEKEQPTEKSDIDFFKARARLIKEQADAQELKNQIMREEVAPVTTLRDALARVCEQVNSILEAIPLKVKNRVPALKAKDVEIIKREIVKAQNAASHSDIDFDDIEGTN